MAKLDRNSIEEFKLLEESLYSARLYMEENCFYNDAVIFMGNTKSGQSTLINYIIGYELIGEEIKGSRKIRVKKSYKSSGPKIGIGPMSETSYPSCINIFDLALWDFPGFDDEKGEIQDITNAFFIFELFKMIKSTKIILVIDINDIQVDKIESFLSMLNSVNDILKGNKMEECFNCIGTIFSKVPGNISEVEVNKNNILSKLEILFFKENSKYKSHPAKDLVRKSMYSFEKLGIFSQAELGNLKKDQIDDIIETIQNTSSINENILKHLSPNITERSKLFFFEVRHRLFSPASFTKLQELLSNIITDKVIEFKKINTDNITTEKLQEQSNLLKNLEIKLTESIDYEKNFDEKLRSMREIDPSIMNLIDKHNLIHSAVLMDFSDRVFKLQETKEFDIKLYNILISALLKVNELILNMKLKLMKIDKVLARVQIATLRRKNQNEKEKMKETSIKVAEHNANEKKRIEQVIEIMRKSQDENDKRYAEFIMDLRNQQERIREEDRCRCEKRHRKKK